MSLVTKLACLALRPALRGVPGVVLPGVELITAEAAGAIEQFFLSRFTDPSKQLVISLHRAADRSWRAVEIALAGESFWSWLTDRGEDKAFRADIRTFLDSNPLQLPPGRDETSRRAALDQLRAARKVGLIPGGRFLPKSAAKQTTDFLRFSSPGAVCEAEWRVMAEVAGALRECRHLDLADLVELRPVPNQPPLLAVAVRFFFRREVETNRQLFQGLVYDRVDQVGQALEAGLGRLQDALQNHGERLLEILALTETIHADVLDLKAEQANQGDRLREIYSAVSELGEKLDRLHERSLRPTDGTSVRGGAERELIRAVKAKFRALPEAQRQGVPALLNAIGKLEMAAGENAEAQQDFRQVASMVDDKAAKAEAHHGAFLAALEMNDKTTALNELLEATRLDPERFALFPDRYEPERILGAGGFGIVFLCRNRLSNARVVVKSLRTDEIDRDLSAVLQEAGALEQLNHEAIIRLRDCGCVDTNQTRPYLVMDYFGISLDEFIKENGALSLADARLVACQMAEGLSVAHAHDILHRDVKPGNVQVDRSGSGLRVKLIDFGLAMRLEAMHRTMTNAGAMANTVRGQSIAGTLDYASPEQMGKLPGEGPGRRSDVYGFGRTLCFALFGTPNPTFSHWLKLQDEQFRDLINECINESPKSRPDGFPAILDRLGWRTAHQPQPVPVATAVAAPIEVTHQPQPVPVAIAVAAPIEVTIPAVPVAQVAPSDLPQLPQDVLVLEGRLIGLRQTIETVEHGQHPELREGWKALDGHTTSGGQPLIESLKQKIEKTPSCRDSELCALAPDAPQWAVLVVISGFKRLVELKGERGEVERQLATRQEEDFRGILARFLAQSAGEKFPLASWIQLEPKLAVRRYVFAGNARELLRKAEEHFASICEERKAERLRLERESEEGRRQEEAAARQRELELRQRQTESARKMQFRLHYTWFGLIGAIVCLLVLGGLGFFIGARPKPLDKDLVFYSWVFIPFLGWMAGHFVHMICFPDRPGKDIMEIIRDISEYLILSIGGVVIAIVIVNRVNGGFPSWTAVAGLLWGGLAGALIGLALGLCYAAKNEPK